MSRNPGSFVAGKCRRLANDVEGYQIQVESVRDLGYNPADRFSTQDAVGVRRPQWLSGRPNGLPVPVDLCEYCVVTAGLWIKCNRGLRVRRGSRFE